jgi:hypothetical protein
VATPVAMHDAPPSVEEQPHADPWAPAETQSTTPEESRTDPPETPEA